MAESFRTFEDLECWKASKEVRLYITKLIKKFPPEEKYNLTDDMKRAARSTTHNIAEGYGLYHYQEFIQFCRHSRGSLTELIDQLITSLDDEYISKEEYDKGRELINKAIALLNGFINYLERAKLKEEESKKKTKTETKETSKNISNPLNEATNNR